MSCMSERVRGAPKIQLWDLFVRITLHRGWKMRMWDGGWWGGGGVRVSCDREGGSRRLSHALSFHALLSRKAASQKEEKSQSSGASSLTSAELLIMLLCQINLGVGEGRV